MSEERTTMDDNTVEALADLFKIFGDTTRIKILDSLCDGEMSVNDIAEKLAMTQSAVSHQLKILRTSKLARARREGKQMFYTLADDHVRTIIGVGREHISEDD